MLLCRQAEQISRCVRFWGAAVGDVHRATALEWTGADAGHLPSDSAQEEAAVPVRYSTTTTGAASSSSSPSYPLTLLLLPLPPHLLCCIFFFLSSNSPAAASSAAASSSLSSAASSSPSCPPPLLLLPLPPYLLLPLLLLLVLYLFCCCLFIPLAAAAAAAALLFLGPSTVSASLLKLCQCVHAVTHSIRPDVVCNSGFYVRLLGAILKGFHQVGMHLFWRGC